MPVFIELGSRPQYDISQYLGGPAQSNGNSITDACDLASGLSNDCNNDSLPDECAPLAREPNYFNTETNRFVSFRPDPTADEVAVRLTVVQMPPGMEQLEGAQAWLSEPVEVSEDSGAANPLDSPGYSTIWVSALACDPSYLNLSGLAAMYVQDEVIVPNATYELQSIAPGCDTLDERNYSDPIQVSTSRFGDVVGSACFLNDCFTPDGEVAITTDVTIVLEKFRNRGWAPSKYRCDLEPAKLDFLVNISDVSMCLDAFRSLPYPFTPTAPPCGE